MKQRGSGIVKLYYWEKPPIQKLVFCKESTFNMSNTFILGTRLPEPFVSRTTVCAGYNIRASCPSGEVIAVENIFYGTKRLTICETLYTSIECCNYDRNDCFTPYTDLTLHTACSGRDLCIDVSIVRSDTSICGYSFPVLNHYITMEYHCVPGKRYNIYFNRVRYH